MTRRDHCRPRRWRWRLSGPLRQILLIAGVVSLCALVWPGRRAKPPIPTPPPHMLGGWAGAEAEAAAQAALPAPPRRFALAGGPVETRGKNVRLWEAVRLALGRDLPHFRQLIGDCVAVSTCNAIMYRQAVAAAIEGQELAVKRLYPPYLYGCARVNVGISKFGCAGLRSGAADGCTNTCIAAAAAKFGLLAADEPGLPEYSAAVAREWGCYGAPEKWRQIGARSVVRTTARVRSEPEAAQAVCNGYPLTIASNWGGRDKCRVVAGRLLNERVGQWSHQMAVLAYDDGDGDGRGFYYVLNQWGEDYHGADPAGGPPGGFWIAAQDMQWIIRDGEVIAWSSVDGFPAADWEVTMRRWRDWWRQRALVAGGVRSGGSGVRDVVGDGVRAGGVAAAGLAL